jgi:hypothetical protein
MNLQERIKERIKERIYEQLGRKRSKKHIESEWQRHNSIALKSCEYIGILLFMVCIYFLSEGIFTFQYFFLSLGILYISHWMPDFLYLFSKALMNDRTYIPSHKRKYSHGIVGLFSWTLLIFLLSYLYADVFWCIILTALAFVGYWTHLMTDKVELFIDKLAEFFEKALREEE